jgi:hypothetical protein
VAVAPAPVAPRAPRSGWRADATDTLETLERALDDLVVRGLSAARPDDLRVLAHAKETFENAGAAHLVAGLSDLLDRHNGGDVGAARALLHLQSTLRVFERFLSLEAAVDACAAADVDDADDDADADDVDDDADDDADDIDDADDVDDAPTAAGARAIAAPPPRLPQAEIDKLLPVLQALGKALEDLVQAGLVTASSATKEKIELCFKEASRLKLGRVAASLRYANEEIQRYLDGAPTFSAKRLALFLNRSWILARGLDRALREKNDVALARLLLTAVPRVVDSVTVVCVGVRKRVPQGVAVCAFDFHCRVVAGGGVDVGAPLIWSHIVARKDPNIQPEALLHLELKPQGLKPVELMTRHAFTFTSCALTDDGRGGVRLAFSPDTRVQKGPPTTGRAVGRTDRRTLARRYQAHTPSPLDLEVELADEVCVALKRVAAPAARADKADVDVATAVIAFGDAAGAGVDVEVDIPVARTEEAKELRTALRQWVERPPQAPVFGVLHVDHCRWVFVPLSIVDDDGPKPVMVSTAEVDLKALMKSLF